MVHTGQLWRAVPHKEYLAQRPRYVQSPMAKAWWTSSPSKNMARWPRNITSHKQILLDTVLYGSVKQKRKQWRTKILWAEKGSIIFPVEINVFTVLNKKRIKNKWSETPLTFNQKRAKRELKANMEPLELLCTDKSTRGRWHFLLMKQVAPTCRFLPPN